MVVGRRVRQVQVNFIGYSQTMASSGVRMYILSRDLEVGANAGHTGLARVSGNVQVGEVGRKLLVFSKDR